MGDTFADDNGIGCRRKEPSTVFNPDSDKWLGPSPLTFVSVLIASSLFFLQVLQGYPESR